MRRFKVSYGTPLAANSGVVAGVANPSIKLTHYQLLKIGPDRRGLGSARNQSLSAVRPSQITHVVNSHYHIDHCGGNKYCTHASTVCHQCELEVLKVPAPNEQLACSDISFAPGIRQAAPLQADAGVDPARALESLDRLVTLAERHDAELFFSHDPESWSVYQRAPGYYS